MEVTGVNVARAADDLEQLVADVWVATRESHGVTMQ